MGDGVLVEFPSVVEAVECALAIQRALAAADSKIRLRIGINLGDVIIDGDDIYGDGVNVAARLQALAEPGVVAMSSTVHEQVRRRVEAGFEPLGPKQLKNIAEPVEVWQWTANGVEHGVSPAARLTPPNKPSIAVLPFDNLSGDPEQEYFADGITEDIITELSRFRELHVIARHSTFFFKGKAAMVRDIGDSLKVEYIVEGSVRKSGGRIRITAQLIDASSETHIWAGRYDRNVDDVFEVQDEVTRAIIGVVAGQVKQSSQRQAARNPTSARVYDYVLRGQAIISESGEANRLARKLYEKAISLDPSCARAHAGVAGTLLLDWMSGWGEPQMDTLGLAFTKAKEALALDDSDLKTRWELGKIHMYRREFEQAEIHLRQALILNPNDTDVMAVLAMLCTYSGKPRQAIHYLLTAKELNPFHPAWYQWFLGFAQFNARQYEQAVATLRETIESGPKFVTPHRHLAACYAQLGKMVLAHKEVEQILELDANFGVDSLIPKLPFEQDEDLQHYLNALTKAGLPR